MEFKIETLTFRSRTEDALRAECLEKITSGEIAEYRLSLTFAAPTVPKKYTLSWEEPQIDTMGFWSPLSGFSPNIRPDWGPSLSFSRTASGMPVACLYNKQNVNRVTVALSDPANPTAIFAGVVEETGSIGFAVELFSQPISRITSYEVVIRIDRRPIPLAEAVSGARDWWGELGYRTAHVPTEAKLPMYSTWYSFHQHTIPEEIIAECAVAKFLGMDTVIVDDGWQTDDNSRGYGFCGDWQISENKIPSMKDFVDRIHALGMKFMIWFSVPFVGFDSENYDRFRGMYLYTRESSRASILDPRFREVREFLTDIYCSYVTEYGWDGLKLDFIDSFRLTEESSTDFDRMDTVSLEEAVEKLLSEVSAKLKAINPEFMIEFRQGYIGPVMSRYGNIFRVADCPNDPLYNRIGALNLRLASGDCAVHSDMIMWNGSDKDEAVMDQLLGTLFAVPQISVRFGSITEGHKRLLSNYLSFWRAHRETILEGRLEVAGAEANYTMVRSTKGEETVCVLYQSVVAPVGDGTTYLFNDTGLDRVYVEMENAALCTLYDLYGNKYREIALPKGLSKINLMNCGMAKIH